MMNKFKQADSVISRPKPTVLSQNVFIHSFIPSFNEYILYIWHCYMLEDTKRSKTQSLY